MAGGKGTRLSLITNDQIPKPMAIINGKPILEHTINSLKKYGVDEFFFTVGHLYQMIVNYFGDGQKFGVKIHYIVEDCPLGSAGALYYLKDKIDGDFIVCSGDVIFDIDIDRMMKFHKKNQSMATLLTHPNSHPYDSDLIVSDRLGRIKSIDSKNNVRDYFYKNNVNAGFFILNSKSLNFFQTLQKVNMEKDFIQWLIDKNFPVYAYKSSEYIKDVGTPERFESGEQDLKNKLVEKRCFANLQKAIFLDRDGTINKYNGFVRKPEELELLNDACEAIRLINKSEYLAIVVSNQPVVARGECTFQEVENIMNKMETELGKGQAYVDAIYYCPHHPHSGYDGEVKELKIKCECRKPQIGMLLKATKDYNLDLSKCIMIGDANADILTARNAGIKAIRVNSDLEENEKEEADKTFDTLLQAVKYVLK